MKKANEATIKSALARLKGNKDEIIRRGMCALLEDAVKIALATHDRRHNAHIKLGDTYGWMLLHDGNIEVMKVISTADNRGRATSQLKKKALFGTFRKGWVGVVMAGLEPAIYFEVLYEMGILDHTVEITRQNFNKYFKPL